MFLTGSAKTLQANEIQRRIQIIMQKKFAASILGQVCLCNSSAKFIYHTNYSTNNVQYVALRNERTRYFERVRRIV